MNESELVLTHILDCDRASLYLNKDTRLDTLASGRLASILRRRISGEPVQYILGETEFMGLRFRVDKRVLIPRPETEILVEKAQEMLDASGKGARVLDLGTGSGCIAVSLAANIPFAEVWAVDVSADALQAARENAALNHVFIKFVAADLFASPELKNERFDLIVSNPPYIPDADLDFLARELSFEPGLALRGGIDGLDFYRRIIRDAAGYLKARGSLILEVGFRQAPAVKEMLGRNGFTGIEITRDYGGIERVVSAKKGVENG